MDEPQVSFTPLYMPIIHHEERPWGRFDWIFRAPGCIVKTLYVEPGQQLSDQRHAKRSEQWYVQTGTPTVFLEFADGRREERMLREGVMVEIPQGTWHRLSAKSSQEPVRITEVWEGADLSEGDIERRTDDYGRA